MAFRRVLRTWSALSFAGSRAVTAEDMQKVLSRAVPPGDYRAVTIMAIQWEMDGEPVESPIAQYGELLGARVEMLMER